MGRRGARHVAGGMLFWWLSLLTLLARLGVCDGDAHNLSARVERVGALTFVVALNLSAPGEVDIVTTRASDYPDWASATPPTLAQLRAAVLPGGAISADPSPPAYFRRTVRVPTSSRETRVLIDGAYNLQRPERSGAYGDFVVYPGDTYVVVVAPRDDSDGVADVTALEVTTASAVSSDASLAGFGVVVSATTDGVVDASSSAAAANLVTLVPSFVPSNQTTRDTQVTKYETSVDAETEEVTVFGLPAVGGAFRVEVNGVVARAGPARFGGAIPAGAYSAGRTQVLYGRNDAMTLQLTAEDRVTTRTYEVRVTRSRSSEARLGALALRGVVTSPAFSQDVFSYTAAVAHDVTSARVFAEPFDVRVQAVRVNAVLIQGVDVGSDAGRGVAREKKTPYSRDVLLRVGSNTVVVEVTAHDASTKSENRVEITRAYPDTDVELAFLEVTSVSKSVTGRHLGQDVVSWSRAMHVLTPAFVAPAAGQTSTILEHATAVENRVLGFVISVAARDAQATISMTQTRLDGWSGNATTGVTSAVAGEANALGETNVPGPVIDFDVNDLLVGRTQLALTVTAEDSRYSKTTYIEVTRYDAGTDAALRDLKAFGEPGDRVPVMTPAFDPDVFEYIVTLDFDMDAVRLVPTATDAMHRLLRVNTVHQKSGESSRTYPIEPGGEYKMTVAVTAHDGVSQRFYVVVAKRCSPNHDAALAGLTIMPTGNRTLVPLFNPNVTEYNLSAPLEHTVSSVRVVPKASDLEYDRVVVNGARQPSGTLSRELFVPPGFGNGVQMTLGVMTVVITVRAQDMKTERTYTVHITRDAAPIYPNDATLRELNVAPTALARLVPGFTPTISDYKLFIPARALYVGVTPVANDVNVHEITVNGVTLENGNETRTTMSELLKQEHVLLRLEVFAANCAPRYRPDGYDASNDTNVDVDGDGVLDLLVDGQYRPTWCTSKTYVVELLEYGPGAYEDRMRLLSGNTEDPTGIVREMYPYPSPFGDTAEFIKSLDQKQFAEFDDGVRSVSNSECDEYLCTNSMINASLVALELRIASTRSTLGDNPLPEVGGDALAFSPIFSNVTRFYVAEVPSFQVDSIEVNVTVASSNVSGVYVDGVAVRSGFFNATVPLNKHGTTAILIEVIAGREDVKQAYTVHVFRPRSNNAFLSSLSVEIGSARNKIATLMKRIEPNLTGVPSPRRACDAYDQTVRAANGVAFHPMCDDASGTILTTADNDPPNFDAASGSTALFASASMGRLTHPCDGDDASTGWVTMCLENETAAAAKFSQACDVAATEAGVLPVAGFHHEWFDYLINVDDSTEFVFVRAETADADAERVGMGASFRNCRAAPRSPGCAGRDVDAVAAWGWTAGESSGGVVAVESGELSPPLDLKPSPGSTTASIAVVSADGAARREYTLRVARENPPPPNAEAAFVSGVGAFLEGLVAASPLGATTDEEVRFTLRFEGMDPLLIVDASFRRELETLVSDYVAYAAVEPMLSTSATATATPRSGVNDSCRRRVAGENTSFVPTGVDVTVTQLFANSTANTTARVLAWIESAGWNDAPGFAFDGYLKSWGPIRVVDRITTRSVPAGFSPKRMEYEVALPTNTVAQVPLVINTPPSPLADGYAVAVNGAATKTGSTTYVSVPQCAIGPNHCDARRFSIEINACVGVYVKTCVVYVFGITIPGATVFATDDASLRNVLVTSGATSDDASVVTLYSRLGNNKFQHDVHELTVFVPSTDLFVFVTVTPNAPSHGGAFVNAQPVVFNGTFPEPVNVSVASLLNAKAMNGRLSIRVFAENGTDHRDTVLRVLSADEETTVGGLTALELLGPLEPLHGVWGFDGGGLPRKGLDDRAPVFVESYPRAEPLVEGGPHIEVAVQTKTPSVVYWALAVPWTRDPTVREVVEAATRGDGVRPANEFGPTRSVLDNETFAESNVTVYEFIAAALNASLASGSGNPSDVDKGLVAGGVLGGLGTFGATHETRATVRCLDPRVTYRAFFVTERVATGVSAHGAGDPNDPPARSDVTQAVVAKPAQNIVSDPPGVGS